MQEGSNYATTINQAYIDVVEQSLLRGGASLGLVIQAKPDGDLVVENQSPDETQDQLQVAINDIATPCTSEQRNKPHYWQTTFPMEPG